LSSLYDVLDTKTNELILENSTPTRIASVLRISVANVSNYAYRNYKVRRRYRIIDNFVEKDDWAKQFTVEWDKVRFRLNPSARRAI
jgi:predicted transcriptional regulator